ncbi:MAG: hypothetical protein ACOY45_10380 [Pseudomonadota bacterium]
MCERGRAIAAALEACAARHRAAQAARAAGGDRAVAADDPDEPFVRVGAFGNPFLGELEPPVALEEWVPFAEGEGDWRELGEGD